MIARKRLLTIVIALCVWLPLQAIAGQWLHCEKLESILTLDKKNLDLKNIDQKTTRHACHEATKQDSASVQSATVTDHHTFKKPCDHCQFVCHWNGVVPLNHSLEFSLNIQRDYSLFDILLPPQPYQATPQRPPKNINV